MIVLSKTKWVAPKWKFPRKRSTVSTYTKALPASRKTQIRKTFRSSLSLPPDGPLPRLTDESREVLCEIIWNLAQDIEDKAEHPSKVSRALFDAANDVHEDITATRQEFPGMK